MKENRNQKKTKIFFIIDILMGFAGNEKHLFDTITIGHLNKESFSCYVIAFKTREYVVDEFKKIGATIVTIPLERVYGFHALRQFFVLFRYIKKIGQDIVQTFHFKSDTFGVLAAKAPGRQILFQAAEI